MHGKKECQEGKHFQRFDYKTLQPSPGRFYFKLFWGGGKEHRDKKRQRVTLNLQHPTESYSHSRFTSMGLHRNWMCECLWKIGKESLMTADMDIQNFI